MANPGFLSKATFYFKEILVFLRTLQFWKHFGGILLALFVCIFLTNWVLKIYTQHGESLQISDFVGMDVSDAVEKAESKQFSVQIIDSVFVPGKKPHTVISQNPIALSRVKVNRTIYLTITKSVADLITLPNLAGGNDDLNQFQKKLGLLGINTRIIDRVFDDKLAENTIKDVIYNGEKITDLLQGGYKAARGSTIDLIVSEKGGTSIVIPNLVCKKFDAAKFVITSFNLSLGTVIKDNTVTDELSAYVWKQVPAFSANNTIRIGEQVDVYLTQNAPSGCAGLIDEN